MIKTFLTTVIIIIWANLLRAQPNFSGTWSEPELQIIEGIQYANALPKVIKVTQTKDSITVERTTISNDGDIVVSEIVPLNGKAVSRITKTSKRTIITTATWDNEGKSLNIFSTYSYPDNPGEVEFKNSEIWLLIDNSLVITKKSDATVTDDWTIKGVYKSN